MNRYLISAAAGLALAGVAQAQGGPGGGERYRATGTEPFWSLTIAHGTMQLKTPEGVVATAPRPDPRPSFNGRRYVTARMTVDVTHARCSDGMSDRDYPDTVTVTVGRRQWHGCGEPAGGASQQPAVEGDWRVLSLDGRPTSAQRPGNIRFERGRVSGSTGCNSFSGGYRFQRGRLEVGPLMTTKMFCSGPAGKQERVMLDLLGASLGVTKDARGRLVLTARGGSTIVLQGARR